MTDFPRVAGPVFAGANADGRVNAGFIRTGKGGLVVDSLVTREDGRRLLEAAVAEAGGVTALVYTHEHADHTIGSTEFPPGGVIASEGTAAGFRDSLEHWADEFARQGIAPKPPTLVFERRIRLPWEPEVVITELGGHAEGSSVVYVPEQKTLFTGDLVFRGRPPYIGQIHPERWLAALRTMEGWDVEVAVPGHGPVGGKDILAEQRLWLERFLGRAADVRSRGTSLEEAVTLLGGEFGFADRQVESLRSGLRRLGWGGPGGAAR